MLTIQNITITVHTVYFETRKTTDPDGHAFILAFIRAGSTQGQTGKPTLPIRDSVTIRKVEEAVTYGCYEMYSGVYPDMLTSSMKSRILLRFTVIF